MEIYRTLTGRRYDLGTLSVEERAALDEVRALYWRRPAWDEFARAWIVVAREKAWGGGMKTPVGSALYRICQDMELSLGVAEGRMAPPDYRDQIVDLIEDRFGSRYAFCKVAGVDQGHLSHVLAGKKNFSIEAFFHVLDALQVNIELVDRNYMAPGAEASGKRIRIDFDATEVSRGI